MYYLSDYQALELADLRRRLAKSLLVVLLVAGVLIEVTIGARPTLIAPWQVISIYVVCGLAVAVAGVFLFAALTGRPTALTVDSRGVKFHYRAGRDRTIPWPSWAKIAQLRQVTRVVRQTGRMPVGCMVRLGRLAPYTFWISDAAFTAIRAGAAQAGLVESQTGLGAALLPGRSPPFVVNISFRQG
jgi:hypothetical protein